MPKPQAEPLLYAPTRGRSYIVKDGKIQVDPAKQHILPFVLTTEPEAFLIPGANLLGDELVAGGPVLLAGGLGAQPVAMPIDDKGPFEIIYSTRFGKFTSGPNAGQSTNKYTLVLFDPAKRPLLMNREIHAGTMTGGFGSSLGAGFGTALENAGGRPFVWPQSWFMEPEENESALFVAFRNLTVDSIEVHFALHGVRYYDLKTFEEAKEKKMAMYGDSRVAWPYFYTTDTDVDLAPAPGAGSSDEFDMRITDDADIEIFKMMKASDASFLWRLQEKSSGKRFLDSAGPGVAGAANGVHSDFGFGDGEFPFIPFETMYYEKKTKLILVLTNLDTVNRNKIFITFACRKIHHVE